MKKTSIIAAILMCLSLTGCGKTPVEKYIDTNVKYHECAYEEMLKDSGFVEYINNNLKEIDPNFNFECDWKTLLISTFESDEEMCINGYRPSNEVLKMIEDGEQEFYNNSLTVNYLIYEKQK